MPLTLAAHRQNKKTEQKCALKYSAVINILCDIIADVVDVNMKNVDNIDDTAVMRVL